MRAVRSGTKRLIKCLISEYVYKAMECVRLGRTVEYGKGKDLTLNQSNDASSASLKAQQVQCTVSSSSV